VWLLLALWVAQRPGSDGSLGAATALVAAVTHAGLTPGVIGRAMLVLEQYLGAVSNQASSATKPSRRERLAAALSGAGG
jgi:hypothetical protein